MLTQQVRHPFVVQLGNGTLPRKSFEHYIKQDYLYLRHCESSNRQFHHMKYILILRCQSSCPWSIQIEYIRVDIGLHRNHRSYSS